MNATGNSSDDDDDCFSFGTSERRAVAGVACAVATISIFACLFVIVIMILYKKYLFFTQRLILYLTIAALLNSIAIALHITEVGAGKGYCAFTAFYDQVTSWSILIAICCITVNLMLTVMFHKHTERLEILYFVLIFIFPLTLNWIPFIEQAYGDAGPWCWIRIENDDCSKFEFGIYLQFILWYIPLYVGFASLTMIYIIILYKLHKDRHRWERTYNPDDAKKMKEQMEKEVRPLLWFPLGYLLLYIIPLINRIYNSATGEPTLALWLLTAISLPLEGGFISLAFTLDPETLKRLRWAQFKGTVRQLWQRDVKEYPARSIPGDDSIRKKLKEDSGEEGAQYEELQETST